MNYTNKPPTSTSKSYPIVRVPRGGKVAFTVLTPTYTGLDTHYDGRKTVECPPSGDCLYCDNGQQSRWQGYVLGQGADTAFTALFHFTNNAVTMIRRALSEDRTWLFRKIVLVRGKGHDNSPLQAHVYGVAQGLEAIPLKELIDTVKSIYRKNGRAPLRKARKASRSNG